MHRECASSLHPPDDHLYAEPVAVCVSMLSERPMPPFANPIHRSLCDSASHARRVVRGGAEERTRGSGPGPAPPFIRSPHAFCLSRCARLWGWSHWSHREASSSRYGAGEPSSVKLASSRASSAFTPSLRRDGCFCSRDCIISRIRLSTQSTL